MKAYREVCTDLMMMLEDLEESLNDITRTAELSESGAEKNNHEVKSDWLERYFDFTLKH